MLVSVQGLNFLKQNVKSFWLWSNSYTDSEFSIAFSHIGRQIDFRRLFYGKTTRKNCPKEFIAEKNLSDFLGLLENYTDFFEMPRIYSKFSWLLLTH